MDRKLAAILAADVVGYSAMMERDEAGTHVELRACRQELFEPTIARHHGTIFKRMGDGMLAEFSSVVEAVQCAVALQLALAERYANTPRDMRVEVRIGVNLGEVIVEGDDRFGDGVNIAARLEGLSEPGGVSVSASVYEQVRRKLDIAFDDLGTRSLKNIGEPLQVYRAVIQRPADGQAAKAIGNLRLPAKPSIAVLPFTNMGGDAEDMFVDGLSEDIITDLSRNASLFVIARHSTFAYKGKALDIRHIARDLGVRYVLEGSARRAVGRVRINVQLIDAVGGDHLWADRFDRDLEDVFAVQDEVTARVVEALVGRLTTTPPARNRPNSLEAYDLVVRARALISSFAGTPDAVRESEVLTRQAISIDPNYAEAYRWLAFSLWSLWNFSIEPAEVMKPRSVAMAQKAVELDPNDAGNQWVLAYLLAYERRWDELDAHFEAALNLDPNDADTLAMRADLLALNGNYDDTLDFIQRALRLNPQPAGWYYWVEGIAHYVGKRYDAAIEILRKKETYRSASRRVLAASLAQLGRTAEARQEAALFMATSPTFTISAWTNAQPSRHKATIDHFADGYRKAGLPE